MKNELHIYKLRNKTPLFNNNIPFNTLRNELPNKEINHCSTQNNIFNRIDENDELNKNFSFTQENFYNPNLNKKNFLEIAKKNLKPNICLKNKNIIRKEEKQNENRFILVKDIKKYNSFINKKLNEIEIILKSDMELNNEYKSKINKLSNQIKENEKKEENLKKEIEDKNKIIDD